MMSCSAYPDNSIDLSGKWGFMVDPNDTGLDGKWYLRVLEGEIHLPGSMAINGYGDEISVDTKWTGQIVSKAWYTSDRYKKYRVPGNIKIPFWLQPSRHYVGVAWYKKNFQIPVSWQGKHLELFLERCHWETRVWIDDVEIGMKNSLGTPNLFDLGIDLPPGLHTLTVRIDNRIKDIDPGVNAHSVTDHTQTNWNGIAGEMKIVKRPVVLMEDVRIFPDVKNRSVRIEVLVNNECGYLTPGYITVSAESFNSTVKHKPIEVRKAVDIHTGEKYLKLEYALGAGARLWDEYHPNMYRLKIQLSTDAGIDRVTEVFGLREFKAKGSRFTINGRPVFLRGTLECAVFPQTGFPATDTARWAKIFKTAASYGLNHVRFHSWCPPEAAFEVADRMGFYLQVECSAWANIGDGKPIDEFIMEESERIVKFYGNHPSFCMLAYGNEPGGKNRARYLTQFVRHWKEKDLRRVYTGGAGWPALKVNDYNNLPQARIQGWGQGLNSRINKEPPSTDFDYSSIVKAGGKPYVSHEIGQWCAYPDFKEMESFKGVLKEKNFEIFRESLEEHQMRELADSFLLASGKLQALCYKADIEAALRTPGMAGFQLLGLSDFPGQGTALVGVVNALWDEKGYIKPNEFKRFCSEVVPLARFPKRIYKDGEKLEVPVEVAYFGEKENLDVRPQWFIRDGNRTVIKGKLIPAKLHWGNSQLLGVINQKLELDSGPVKWTLAVSVSGFANQWDFWVYPKRANIKSLTNNIRIVNKMNAKTNKFLKNGGKVLLTLGKGGVKKDKGGDVGIGFSSIFWNTAWTRGQKPHTLGIFCDPGHPALAEFPTEYHSNWQWWYAMSHSDAIVLDELPETIHPIVRVIDDWFTNRRLALIFEAKVGKGKIIITGIDLKHPPSKYPEARQLLYSLIRYMDGDSFDPKVELSEEDILSLIK